MLQKLNDLVFLKLYSSDRAERLGMCDWYVELHRVQLRGHQFSKLSILLHSKNLCIKSHIIGGSARAHEAAIGNIKVDKIKYVLLYYLKS